MSSLWFIGHFSAGVVLPGFLLGRLIGTPAVWLTSFLASIAFLFHLLLALEGLAIPITPASVSAGLLLVNGTLLLLHVVLRKKARSIPGAWVDRPGHATALPGDWRWSELLWLLPVLFALAAVTTRAVLDPLSGYDNGFRWDFIARQLLQLRTLSFYPPMSVADYQHYAWSDGIPPLVPFLNFWSYVSADSTVPAATAPRIMLEAGLLFQVTWLLARQVGGRAAAWPAAALLATSSLAIWSVAMGQETGLTGLTLVAMYYFLTAYEQTGARSTLIWAGLAAGLGALSREYGLAWTLLGLVTLWLQGNLKSGWRVFTGTAVAVGGSWYIRNWLHTGNPLFSHGLAGLFWVNPAQARIMHEIGRAYIDDFSASFVWFATASLAVLSGPLLLLGFCAALKLGKNARALFVGLLAGIALWLFSIPQTGGGWLYALRVLSPVTALAAVLGGSWLARRRWATWPLLAFVCLLAADAALRACQLPTGPLDFPWQLSPTGFSPEKNLREYEANHPFWAALAAVAKGRGVIVDQPGAQVALMAHGVRALPLQSPAAAPIFDTANDYAHSVIQLRAAGIRFILITPKGLATAGLIRTTPFLTELQRREKSVVRTHNLQMFDLDSINPQ